MTSSYKPGELSSLFNSDKKTDKTVASLFANPAKPVNSAFQPFAQLQKQQRASKKRKQTTMEEELESAKKARSEEEQSSEEEEKDESEDDASEAEQDAKQAAKDTPDASKDAKTLFVGNVPISSKGIKSLRRELEKHFAKFAKVESVRVRSIPIASTGVPSNSNYKTMIKASVRAGQLAEDATTCNAYVVFASEEELNKVTADKGNSSLFKGNHLRFDRVGEFAKGQFDRRRTVFVGNMPFSTNEEAVRQFFDNQVHKKRTDAGKKGNENPRHVVENVRLIRDKATNKGKGFGYVCFKQNSDMEAALKLHETPFQKRKIRVTRCERSARAARPGATEASFKFQGERASNMGARIRIKNKGKKGKNSGVKDSAKKKKKMAKKGGKKK